MASRIKDLTIEQLTQLVESCNQQIENIKLLRDQEQAMTHAKHPDPRYTAIISTLEMQRTGYSVLRTRKTIIGR